MDPTRPRIDPPWSGSPRRSLERPCGAFGESVEVVPFDYTDPTMFDAFSGIDRMFLLRPPTIADVDRVIAPALDAARKRQVRAAVLTRS